MREALCELELPYILQNVGTGSQRTKLLVDSSGFQEVSFSLCRISTLFTIFSQSLFFVCLEMYFSACHNAASYACRLHLLMITVPYNTLKVLEPNLEAVLTSSYSHYKCFPCMYLLSICLCHEKITNKKYSFIFLCIYY